MVLRNHGLLTVGPSIPECFNNMFRLERACQLQVMVLLRKLDRIDPSYRD